MEESPSLSAISDLQNEQENNDDSAAPVQDDLTNLNWVAGIPVPMNTSVSPPEGVKARKLFFGPSCAKNAAEQCLSDAEIQTPSTCVKTKPLKVPLPTFKIVVKDQKEHCDNTLASNGSSPDRKDSVIFANIVNKITSESDHINTLELDSLPDRIGLSLPNEVVCLDVEKEEIIKDADTDEDIDDDEEDDAALQEKPNCSYTCLIGMALKASNGCLPVNAIYQYVEKEFPYFLTAPDGWKNSVRHNLSLNPIFRKVNREGWTGKKGYLWEVSPDKQELVDKEILRFLSSTGKKLGKFVPAAAKASYPKTKYKPRSKSSSCYSSHLNTGGPIICSRCTRILSPTPQDSSTSSDDSPVHLTEKEMKKYSIEAQEEVTASDIQMKPKLSATQPTFDTEKSPSKYIGIKPPSNDPREVAEELFGLGGSSPDIPGNYFSMGYGGGPFMPFYPHPSQFGIPMENFDQFLNTSSSSSSSTSPLNQKGANFPSYFQQYAIPFPIQYMYPQMYNFSGNGCVTGSSGAAPKNAAPKLAETSIKVLSSSDQMERGGEPQDMNDITKGKHQNDMDSYPEITSLSSPLKRLKVADDGGSLAADELNISAYFADVSANGIGSDEDVDESEELPDFMSFLLKSNQQEESDFGHSANLDNFTLEERKNLEELAGNSDLRALLCADLENSKNCKKDESVHIEADPGSTYLSSIPNIKNNDEIPKENHNYMNNGEKSENGCITSVDLHDIDSTVTSSRQDNYFLPSLDSLLHLGDNTIVTIKTAMNLDIQGVVEVSTEDDAARVSSPCAV